MTVRQIPCFTSLMDDYSLLANNQDPTILRLSTTHHARSIDPHQMPGHLFQHVVEDRHEFLLRTTAERLALTPSEVIHEWDGNVLTTWTDATFDTATEEEE